MPANLIALYKQPPDPEAFDKAYFETHIPLIEQVPGIQSTTVQRITRTIMGEGYYLLTVMTFADMDALKAGMRSPEMAAAGDNLNSFAEGLVTLMFAEEA